MATVTRADLTHAVVDEVELSDREARALVDSVIETVTERLTAGGDGDDLRLRHLHRARQEREDGPQPEDRRGGGDLGAARGGVPGLAGP